MPLKNTRTRVALGIMLLLLAAPCFGQGPQGLQIFALDDESTYGGAPAPNEGYFFSFDGLWWSISPPRVHSIGAENVTRIVSYGPNPTDARTEVNTLDTSQLSGQFSLGNRFEFGRVDDGNGWFVSIFQVRNQEQSYSVSAADVVFNDPPDGTGQGLLRGNVNNNALSTPPFSPPVFRDLPVLFNGVTIQETVNTWGVEANYLHRFMTRHAGGTFELYLGARYIEFNNGFNVYTSNDVGTGTVPAFLAGSSWATEAENHIPAGQIGLRWFKKQGRWTLNTEGRFFAGLNCQNISQVVDMGPNLNPGSTGIGTFTPFEPTRFNHTAATHVEYAREFTPGVELRLELRFQVTRAIAAHAGWTGMWMDNIARASSVVDYTVPAMGVNLANNRENLFLNGVTFGFDINR